MDLLVSYSWGHYRRARGEVLRILHRLGDEQAFMEKTAVPGIARVRTCLDNREVIRQCKALAATEPVLEFAMKWLPVDYWCETDLDSMKQVIDAHIKNRIKDNETWAMRVKKRSWQAHPTIEIIETLAKDVDRSVKLTQPDWIVHVDILGARTAIALLKPGDVFSLRRPTP